MPNNKQARNKKQNAAPTNNKEAALLNMDIEDCVKRSVDRVFPRG